LLLGVDEDGAQALEPPHDMVVVDDLVPHVDRRTVLVEQPLDDLDRPVDTGAERTRGCEQDAFTHASTSTSRRLTSRGHAFRPALRERTRPASGRGPERSRPSRTALRA